MTKDEMVEAMLLACPSLRRPWNDFLRDWPDEAEQPLYLGLARLARHLIALLADGSAAELSRAFAVVERWHVEGDAEVREAATIGMLENLQNDNLHSSTAPRDFEPFLRAESLECWRRLEEFWEGGQAARK